MYTLEEIKNFTPAQRNDFIDEIIVHCEYIGISICAYISHKTDFIYQDIPRNQYFTALKIPLIKDVWDNRFETMEQRVTFLKAIKTAE